MSDHAKADALVDDILHGKAAGGYGKKHKSGRAAQYAAGDEHHSDELGLLEDLGDVMGVGSLFGGGKKKGKKKKGGGGGSHKHLDFDVFTGATTVTDDGGDDDDGWDDDGGGSEGSEELDSDGVLSDEGGGRGGDDDSSDGALSDIGDAAAAFARKGADALTRLAATKTFMCHIHNIKLQSLERRRRDLILHFSVGVPDEDVSAEVEAEAAAEAEAEGDGADGGDGDGKKKKKRVSFRRKKKAGGAGGAAAAKKEKKRKVHATECIEQVPRAARAILGRAIIRPRKSATAHAHPTSTGRARQDGGVQASGARQVARAVRRRAEAGAARRAGGTRPLRRDGRARRGAHQLGADRRRLDPARGRLLRARRPPRDRDVPRLLPHLLPGGLHLRPQLHRLASRRALRSHATPPSRDTPHSSHRPIYTHAGAPRT